MSPRARSKGRGVRPWLGVVVGLAIALVAIYALLTGVFVKGTGAPSERIDERSRAGLREVLRQAEEER
jgi:hypothetical protein